MRPRPQAWIFTSATLGDDARLSWFTEPCGLEKPTVLRVGSPFDYAAQAALYLPRDLPKPADPATAPRSRAGGLAAASGWVAARWCSPPRCARCAASARTCSGGSRPRRRRGAGAGPMAQDALMERCAKARRGGPRCLLVASASFWEGVDVPGDALQLVVIDKLPFPPPGDPLVEARGSGWNRRAAALQRLLRAGSRRGPEAGRRPPDPPRDRPRRAGGVRHAAGDDGVWAAAAGGAAADAPPAVAGRVPAGAGRLASRPGAVSPDLPPRELVRLEALGEVLAAG
jgi:hypothetical protein